jgi:hypothetical protein
MIWPASEGAGERELKRRGDFNEMLTAQAWRQDKSRIVGEEKFLKSRQENKAKCRIIKVS